jgi:hypothetical protein
VSGWRPVAEATREALRQLGYGMPTCLPGEPGECGGSDAEHAAANLGALRAVVGYRITHLGSEARPLVDEVTARVCAELAAGPPCDQHHQEDGQDQQEER